MLNIRLRQSNVKKNIKKYFEWRNLNQQIIDEIDPQLKATTAMTVIEISSHQVEIRKSLCYKPTIDNNQFPKLKAYNALFLISLKNHFYNLFNDKIIFKARN